MNVETLGLAFAIWALAGFGFCALWAFSNRDARDHYRHGTMRAHQLCNAKA